MLIETPILTTLAAGMPILYGGNRLAHVDAALAERFKPGDQLIVIDGEILHLPAEVQRVAATAIDRAASAFLALGSVSDEAITRFYEEFARHLENETIWHQVVQANAEDVAAARARGRSTTRLAVSERMRADMIAGLRLWRDLPSPRGRVVETIEHEGWTVEQVVDGLGVVGFVFEGRPNVFADATGVLRGGNTVVFRIGSDALKTAQAMMAAALRPAVAEAGLPEGVVELVESAERAAGWAMFADGRLALAVARGSGQAVAQLGAVARQAGVPVSLHGTGGAWIIADESADADAFAAAVGHSLDRKVCNSLNVCAIVRSRPELVSRFLATILEVGDLRFGVKLHVAEGSEDLVPADWFGRVVTIRRAEGDRQETLAERLPIEELGTEWEWEETPELTLVGVESVDEAVRLCNAYSPRFIASLISTRPGANEAFFRAIDAPFVGNGFTRWVDGQYALNRPELGLSNWQGGRLFGRGGVLSGDSVFTIRTRATQTDLQTHR